MPYFLAFKAIYEKIVGILTTPELKIE